MKQRNKLLLIFSLFAISLLVLAVYAGMRIRQISRLQLRVDALDAQEARLRPAGDDLERLKNNFPAKADISSFVEGLYAIARDSGLENVEITTMKDTKPGSVRTARGSKDGAPPLLSYHLRISCEGDYRALGEYFGRMRGLKRYNKIVSFEIKSGGNAVQANLIVEIMSFEEQNAS